MQNKVLDPDAPEFRPARHGQAPIYADEHIAQAIHDVERWERPTGHIISGTPGMQGAPPGRLQQLFDSRLGVRCVVWILTYSLSLSHPGVQVSTIMHARSLQSLWN